MNRPPYAHAQQRSARLWAGDDLFHLVDEVPPVEPEQIPVGEAQESDWGAFVEASEVAR